MSMPAKTALLEARARALARACVTGLVFCVVTSGCTNAPRARALAQRVRALPSNAVDAVRFSYEVHFVAGRELAVEGTFDESGQPFTIAEDAAAFVQDVEFSQGSSWVTASRDDTGWRVPCASGCKLRYRFLLREACDEIAASDTAVRAGEVLIAPSSTWLLHPRAAKSGAFELYVDAGAGAYFVSAFHEPAGARAHTYRAPISVLDDATYAAFGPLTVAEIPAGDTTIELAVAPHGLSLTQSQIEAWVRASAGAVASYYAGHLPARHTLVLMMKGKGRNTRGLTLGGGGPAVLIAASDLVNAATTGDDWVLTHELLHANFPDLGRRHAWLSEGLATYLEPVARARVGLIAEPKLWRDLLDGLPQGLPLVGDQGLENTQTWGRTYWGGALFCLLADLTLRERTGNQRSLDDVLLAIGKTGASDEDHWPIERVLEAAERATGTRVLRELYQNLAEKPGTVDLPALFQRLGVRAQGASVVFDESAPLAKIRRSITAARPG